MFGKGWSQCDTGKASITQVHLQVSLNYFDCLIESGLKKPIEPDITRTRQRTTKQIPGDLAYESRHIHVALQRHDVTLRELADGREGNY